MDQKKYLSSDELLEKIFYYMSRLFEEKELSTTLFLLTDLGKALVNSDRASFWFWDKRRHVVWTLAALGIDTITIPENSGLVGAAMSGNEILIINDPYNDPRFNPAVDKESGYVTKSILTMPVTNNEGKVIGAYQAVNKINVDGSDGEFTEEDVKRLSLATAFCGRSLESYMLYNEAMEDPLTGLRNRRGLHAHYERRIATLRIFEKASIIMCDIDHFKRVNDTYGHNAGDEVLKFVANLLQNSIRIDDGAFRWGGEEFILLLPHKSTAEAVVLAERLRSLIEESVITFEGTDIKVTMSFGVSEINPELTTEENVEAVDAKLYYAKEHGRNRVISELPDSDEEEDDSEEQTENSAQ
ncbi:MAG: sensor domain-containing diguanylate cyclase [Lachnospiraceae bacterium]|nr:sensor domain-containing diguanylate cyclase [Lachnospiraceae bacterium]